MFVGPENKTEVLMGILSNISLDSLTESQLIVAIRNARRTETAYDDDINHKAIVYPGLSLQSLCEEKGWVEAAHILKGKSTRAHAGPVIIDRPSLPLMSFGAAPEEVRLLPILEEPTSQAGRLLEAFNHGGNLDMLMAQVDHLAQCEHADKAPLPTLKRMAIQGGGAKGAAYPGTFKGMENFGLLPYMETYCGASAGAITASIIGQGYNGAQFKAMSDQIDFRDFTDYNNSSAGSWFGGTLVGQVFSVIASQYVFTGQNFHDWIKGQAALNYDNPDITLAEIAEQYPDAPEMLFMGTRMDNKAAEEDPSGRVTFSNRNVKWRNARFADSVRSSMSFPFAWEPITTKDGQGRNMGTFSDGGILSNLPIEQLDVFDDHNRPYRHPLRQAFGGQRRINPATFGASLTTKINARTETCQFLTEREQALRTDSGLTEPSAEIELTAEEIRLQQEALEQAYAEYGRSNIFKKLVQNKIAFSQSSSAEDKEKLGLYQGQVMQIYCEGVDTLEFEVSAEKISRIEASGENAFYNWYLQNRDPSQSYDAYYQAVSEDTAEVALGHKKVFESKLYESDTQLQKSEILTIQQMGSCVLGVDFDETTAETMARLTGLFVDFHRELDIVNHINAMKGKFTDSQQNELAKRFDEIKHNQRLKFLSYNIKRAEKQLNQPELFTACFSLANTHIKKKRQAYEARVRKLQRNLDLAELGRVVLNNLREAQAPECEDATRKIKIAEAVFRGQNSKCLDMLDGNKAILTEFARTGDDTVLLGVLEKIRTICHQLDQQGRGWPITCPLLKKAEGELIENFARRFDLLMQYYGTRSLYDIALASENPKILDVLLSQSARGQFKFANPLMPNEHGKTALHQAIEANNPNAFVKMVQACIAGKHDISQVDEHGDRIIHTLIRGASKQFLLEISHHPDVIKALISMAKPNLDGYSVNKSAHGFGLSLSELCHLRLQQSDLDQAEMAELLQNIIGMGAPVSLEANIGRENQMHHYSMIAQGLLDARPSDDFIIMGEESADGFNALEALATLTPSQSLDFLCNIKDADGESLICSAAKSNNPLLKEKVADLIAKIVSSKQTDYLNALSNLINQKVNGQSALYYACQNGYVPFARLLLEHGASIDEAGSFAAPSALTVAAQRGHLDVVDMLMQMKSIYGGCSRIIQDQSGQTPLHYLASNPACSKDTFWAFFNASYKITSEKYLRQTTIRDNEGLTIFDHLIIHNRIDIIQEIIEQLQSQYRISKSTRGGWYLDHCFDVYQSLPRLLELGKRDKRYEPLCKLVMENLSEKALFTPDNQGQTILHYAAKFDFIDPSKFYTYLNRGLTSGMKFSSYYKQRSDAIDKQGKSALRLMFDQNPPRKDIIDDLAKHYGSQSSRWYVDHYLDMQAVRADGQTDLEYIIDETIANPTSEKLEFVKLLLETISHEFYEKPDSQGRNPLHYLAMLPQLHDSGELFKRYLNRQLTSGLQTVASYHHRTQRMDENGLTPFMMLVMNKRLDIIQSLKSKLNQDGGYLSSEWKFEDYFDFTQVGEDGLTDLARLIQLKQTDPSYTDIHNFVRSCVRPKAWVDAERLLDEHHAAKQGHSY